MPRLPEEARAPENLYIYTYVYLMQVTYMALAYMWDTYEVPLTY